MLKDMSIKSKIRLGFGLLLLITIITAAIAWNGISKLSTMYDLDKDRSDASNYLTEASSMPMRTYDIIADAIINRNMAESKDLWAKKKVENNAIMDSVGKLVDTDKEKGWYKESRAAWDDLVTQIETKQFPACAASVEVTPEIKDNDGQTDAIKKRISAPLDSIRASLAHEREESSKAYDDATAAVKSMLITAVVISLVIGLLLAFFIIASILTPITRFKSMLSDIAHGSGDLTARIAVDSRDEVGEMAQLFNTFVEKIQQIIEKISASSTTLSSASEELSAVSTQLSGNASEVASQSQTVAAATEQATTNIASISDSATQMSSSVNTIASAIEEMSASLGNVAKNCQRESKIAADANAQAQNTRAQMERLGNSADEIGNVVDVISDIAEQTNLLALNATIEAATAGEAGKGFAVVANEVKELAKQTAQATQKIVSQIEDMQENTKSSREAIEQIIKIIEEINGVSQVIVRSVDEQNSTINEIARNVSGVSSGAEMIARNVSESAKGLAEVSRTIGNVNKSTKQTATGVGQITTSSGELTRLASDLQNIVGQFRVR